MPRMFWFREFGKRPTLEADNPHRAIDLEKITSITVFESHAQVSVDGKVFSMSRDELSELVKLLHSVNAVVF